jgi:AcrR family transcriptional regulator
MRYTKEHKQAVRHRLIGRARSLSKGNGFKSTGIDTLMHSVGLSGAAFYRHFASKEDLFSTLIEEEMAQSLKMLGGGAQSSDADFARCLRAYLSFSHATHAEQGCAIPALGAEIARARPQDRRTVEESLEHLKARWTERLLGDSDGAWSALSQCVGALLLARVVERDDTRRKILSAVRRTTGRQFGVSLDRGALDGLRSQHQQTNEKQEINK